MYRDSLDDAPLPLRVMRRSGTIAAYFAAFVISVAGAPLWLTGTLTIDLVRRRGLIVTRGLMLLWLYLAVEVFGLLGCFLLWATQAINRDGYIDRNHRLVGAWAAALFWGAVRIFGIRVYVEGDRAAAGGPVLIFSRHVSPIDNLIPAVFVQRRHRLRLRWVINYWLQRDPCIDIMGHRLRCAFVRGGAREGTRHLRTVATLGEGLGANDGVLLFPEGTLFSPEKRSRSIARLRRVRDEARLERAEGLRNVLPPQLGGALALIERARGADVVFCAHTGLEGGGTYQAVLDGGLVGRDLRVAFWRVPRADIPEEADARSVWLRDQWAKVDAWIEEHRARRPEEPELPALEAPEPAS